MTKEAPLCVQIVRGIVPKNGKSISNTKASRIKRRVKVALEKAGYDVETVRGIGIKFSHYGLKYREKDHTLFGDFCGIDEMPSKAKSSRSKGGRRSPRSKKSPLVTGYHGPTSQLSDKEFAAQVTEELPDHWSEQSPTNQRWVTFDISMIRKTGQGPSQVAAYIVSQANSRLNLWDEIDFTVFNINQTILLGVGPV